MGLPKTEIDCLTVITSQMVGVQPGLSNSFRMLDGGNLSA